jgi:hypothetical protein
VGSMLPFTWMETRSWQPARLAMRARSSRESSRSSSRVSNTSTPGSIAASVSFARLASCSERFFSLSASCVVPSSLLPPWPGSSAMQGAVTRRVAMRSIIGGAGRFSACRAGSADALFDRAMPIAQASPEAARRRWLRLSVSSPPVLGSRRGSSARGRGEVRVRRGVVQEAGVPPKGDACGEVFRGGVRASTSGARA